MSPFLYNGERYEDAIKAQELYEKYFDGSIQKLEKETILKSMKSTWDNDGIEAGLLNVNQEKVLIKKQEITINEKNDIAEIEIYEVYQSQSFDRQEIFYYFSLPQNSVITGLWLSDDDEKKKYAFNVSPRGAAQKVYQQEVQRRVDPSLLEQVGPNQYRLRAFPIEPKTKEYSDRNSFNDFTIEEGSEFHLWLSYKTLINADNEWELPKLLEKRNVYWSDNTELIINNKKVNKGDSWLPKKINTNHIAKIQPHTVQISASTHIKIEPKVLDHSINLENKKIMLLIDGSYSMLKEQEYLLNTLLDFENKGFKPNNINCLIINESIQKYTLNELIKKIENNAALFFGTTNYMNIVNQFKNSNSNSYDAIIILSDKGNYESSEDTLNAIQLNTPLSILHISEQQTPIYNDAFLETIQNSDGHIVRTVNELIDQMNLTKNSNLINYENSIMYSLINTPINKNEKYFSELASQSFIKSLKITADRDRVEQLDQIHQIALREQIVTPYSSMIVLVNESQKEELRKAELEADRFDREVESGDEVIIDPPNSFNVSGTPEPHEWILIGLVLLLLIFRYYQANIKLTR
jgi:putative PEP-CTERM system integral membrane protein